MGNEPRQGAPQPLSLRIVAGAAAAPAVGGPLMQQQRDTQRAAVAAAAAAVLLLLLVYSLWLQSLEGLHLAAEGRQGLLLHSLQGSGRQMPCLGASVHPAETVAAAAVAAAQEGLLLLRGAADSKRVVLYRVEGEQHQAAQS